MGDYEFAIKRCKYLEGVLENDFGANGRGLHEKISSVQDKLPQDLVKKLRFVATVRHQLVHDNNVDRLDNREAFTKACDQAEKKLKLLLAPSGAGKLGCSLIIVAIGGIIAFSTSLLVFVKL